jgi:hypothetical protein
MSRWAGWFVVQVGIVSALFAAVYYSYPQIRTSIIAENELIENFTALTFLLAFVVGGVQLLRSRLSRRQWGLLALVPVLGLVGFLDEISFGENLAAVEMPRVGESDTKIDGAHDVFDLLYNEMRMGTMWAWGVTLLAAAVGAGALYHFRRWLKPENLREFLTRYPAFQFLAVAFGFLAVAIFIDLDHNRRTVMYFFEELFELNAAIAILFAAIAICDTAAEPQPDRVTRRAYASQQRVASD